MPRARFEPAENLNSDFVEWSCALSDNHYTAAYKMLLGTGHLCHSSNMIKVIELPMNELQVIWLR